MNDETFDYLSLEHRLRMRDSSLRLQREFEGIFDAATIDRFLRTSYDEFASSSDNNAYAPTFAERFAQARLRAMVAMEARSDRSVPIVLFLSEHDSSRASMAVGYFTQMVGDRAITWSGGRNPDMVLNQDVVVAMAEDGVDISGLLPKRWNNEIIRAADVIVTLGSKDTVPIFAGRRYIDWELPDPGTDAAMNRKVRDMTKDKVRALVDELGLASSE